MESIYFPFNLNDFPDVDREACRNLIITAKKESNEIIKESGKRAKQSKCYFCHKDCKGFCNSHTVPAFCLRSIAKDGKVLFSNSIIDLPTGDSDKGVNNAGTFSIICRECDQTIFQKYENPDNYNDPPTQEMLAQIDLKNNLKSISKRLRETHMYDIMSERYSMSTTEKDIKKSVSNMDLIEYEQAFQRAKRHCKKPTQGDYYLGYYVKLPYVVPVAFQGNIALIADLDGGIINNIYNQDPSYKIKSFGMAIFPLEDCSAVFLFSEKDNRRYSKFYKQLKRIDLSEQLNIINYILFSYTEDYFLSPTLSKETLKELKALAGITSNMVSSQQTSASEQIEVGKTLYDYNDRFKAPNLLLESFSLSPKNSKEEIQE